MVLVLPARPSSQALYCMLYQCFSMQVRRLIEAFSTHYPTNHDIRITSGTVVGMWV